MSQQDNHKVFDKKTLRTQTITKLQQEVSLRINIQYNQNFIG